MASSIIYEDQFIQVVETTSDSPLPHEPGGWKSVRTIDKPGSPGANRESLNAKAIQALAANATFLAIAIPTGAQNAAQAKALTRQVNGLIRLLLGALEDVSDT